MANAAACCGGGFALPNLITGEDDAQITTSFSYSRVDTNVFSNGIWQKSKQEDILRTIRLQYASIFKDRFQQGFTVPVQSRSFSSATENTASGLGDFTAQIGYEYLTDWSFSQWAPKGIGYLSVTIPTGKNVYDSEVGGLDSLGRGFYSIGIGTTLVKTWSMWDLNSTLEIRKSFDKTVQRYQVDDTVKPGYGGSMTVGSGYNIKDYRFGTSLSWIYEDAVNIQGTNQSTGSPQRNATASLTASYLFPDNWGATISYSDQTLFGDPTNTQLSKSVQLSLQKRWAR